VIGSGASSRNSEVIHAGIYYPPGSTKARLCVQGREMLYDYCSKKNVPTKRLGKIIVATQAAEESALDSYFQTAAANGVTDLQWLSAADVRNLEPDVVAVAGILSPSTGIIDSHHFMKALLADFSDAGGTILLGTKVVQGAVTSPGDISLILDDGQLTTVSARLVVNSAGLFATDVAKSIKGARMSNIPRQHYAIGHYFSLSGRSPFQRLVYPIPSRGGLGVHVTIDMSGAARFGPDVEWVDRVDYTFDVNRKQRFVEAIRRYYPRLDAERLCPGYTGIRAKISGPDEQSGDFLIQGPAESGHQSLIHLFGIESPGLTASLAIAEHVADLVQ
jgi:L-2-hydroxyglutarate oxidase LhgO